MKSILKSVLQMIYPPKCIVCRKVLSRESFENAYICDECYQGVLREHICPKCGRAYALGESYCFACEGQSQKELETVRGIFSYKDGYRKSVLRWKYSGIRKYARGYAEIMVYDLALVASLGLDGLIPVPLAPSRAKQRGFNQALDLANEMSKLSDVPVYDCLVRVKDTKPQSACNKMERMQNIKGSIKNNVNFMLPTLKRVAIVDDIYTTGSTAGECVKALRQQYALKDAKFYLLVVCIGE